MDIDGYRYRWGERDSVSLTSTLSLQISEKYAVPVGKIAKVYQKSKKG